MKESKQEPIRTFEVMPLVPVASTASPDRQPLVNNQSVNSFLTENNQLTITRNSLRDPRKYETLCFQPTEDNRIDIVITKGEYANGRQELAFHSYGSQAIRQQYSAKAKCLVGIVFVMLFTMLLVVLVTLFRGHSGKEVDPHEHLIVAGMGNSTNTTDSSTIGGFLFQNGTYTSTSSTFTVNNTFST